MNIYNRMSYNYYSSEERRLLTQPRRGEGKRGTDQGTRGTGCSGRHTYVPVPGPGPWETASLIPRRPEQSAPSLSTLGVAFLAHAVFPTVGCNLLLFPMYEHHIYFV